MNFRIIPYLISFYTLISCQTTNINEHGGKIKGESNIVFKEIDIALNGQTKISGFVYSEFDEFFLEGAFVEIGDTAVITDKDGFFSIIIKPDLYDISASYAGNTKQSIKKINMSKSEHIIIVFKLGTYWID